MQSTFNLFDGFCEKGNKNTQQITNVVSYTYMKANVGSTEGSRSRWKQKKEKIQCLFTRSLHKLEFCNASKNCVLNIWKPYIILCVICTITAIPEAL